MSRLWRQICTKLGPGAATHCWLWKGKATNLSHSIVRCCGCEPWNFVFLVVLDKGLSCGVVGIRANYRPVARGGGQQQLCEVPVSATSSQWWRWRSSEGGKVILRNTTIREDAHWRLSWPVCAAQHPLPPLTSRASQQKISSQWLQCVFLIISAPSCSRGGACSTAALQLLITNKGCIVYQHLQSAPGTGAAPHVF